jgi:hypothetical protein
VKPSIDARLASVVRSLSDVILPALAEDASLAREQAHLAIGHLGIIRSQLDSAAAFEQAELEDLIQLARSMVALDGVNSEIEKQQLEELLSAGMGDNPKEDHFEVISAAVNRLQKACYANGNQTTVAAVNELVLTHGEKRARLDRQWFAAMGFDNEMI